MKSEMRKWARLNDKVGIVPADVSALWKSSCHTGQPELIFLMTSGETIAAQWDSEADRNAVFDAFTAEIELKVSDLQQGPHSANS